MVSGGNLCLPSLAVREEGRLETLDMHGGHTEQHAYAKALLEDVHSELRSTRSSHSFRRTYSRTTLSTSLMVASRDRGDYRDLAASLMTNFRSSNRLRQGECASWVVPAFSITNVSVVGGKIGRSW